MARYKIYDNTSDVITPVGEKLTAEQWLDRYQWGRYTKMIVGGGIINGSVALVFDDEVERYRKAGCDFSACTTDEDYLAAIEAFEDNPPVADAGVSDQTRIADALEDMVALEPAGRRMRKENEVMSNKGRLTERWNAGPHLRGHAAGVCPQGASSPRRISRRSAGRRLQTSQALRAFIRGAQEEKGFEMSIREYSMTRDSTRQLSPSFRVLSRVRLQGQRRRPHRRRAGGAAAVHPGALR